MLSCFVVDSSNKLVINREQTAFIVLDVDLHSLECLNDDHLSNFLKYLCRNSYVSPGLFYRISGSIGNPLVCFQSYRQMALRAESLREGSTEEETVAITVFVTVQRACYSISNQRCENH